jgi:molecular chaperone DnaK
MDKSGPKHMNYKITRSQFENLVAHLIKRTIGKNEFILNQNNLRCSFIKIHAKKLLKMLMLK